MSIISFEFEPLLGIGLIIIAGLIAGRIASAIKLPAVTGFLVVGIIIGPYSLSLINERIMFNLEVLTSVALGFLIFSIGGQLQFENLKHLGKKIFFIAMGEVFVTFILVFVALVLFNQKVTLALVIASIATETAAATTLVVVQEYRAKGKFTSTLLFNVALSNIFCLVLFWITFSIYKAARLNADVSAGYLFLKFIVDIFGALLLGICVGFIIVLLEHLIHSREELLVLTTGGAILSMGLASSFNLSPIFAALITGALVSNFANEGKYFFSAISQIGPPFYVTFFVLAGSELNLRIVATAGAMGIIYLLMRALGKIIGAYSFSILFSEEDKVRKYLGLSLLPHAGLAIGLSLAFRESFPDEGRTVVTVILFAVMFYELIGPVLTRLALKLSKET